MKRERSWLYRILIVMLSIVLGAVGITYASIYLLLILVSLPDPSRREVTVPDPVVAEIRLRNRTDSMLFMLLKVPRSSLQIDTVWWGVNVAPEAVGYAVAAVAPGLTLGSTVYPLSAPVLLQDSGDTLVADKPIDLPATGQVGKRKLFYPHRNLPLWKERVRQYQPVFEPTMSIQPFSGQPDSVVLLVQVASHGTFLLAREEKRATMKVKVEDVNEDGRTDTLVVTSSALLPNVRWTDSFHHSYKRRVTSMDIRKARTTPPVHDSTEPNKRVYYLDYQ